MATNDPFTAARAAATADLQGLLDTTGDAPEGSGGTETQGLAPTPPFKVDDEDETSPVAAAEATAVADEAAPAVTPPPTPVEEAALTPTPDKGEPKAWTLKHRGKEVVISSEHEVVELAQKGFDYQVKTTELQREKGELHAQWAKKEAALRQFLQSKDMVRAYLNDLEAMDETPGADEPLTVAQAQQMVTQRVTDALKQEREERARQTYTAQVDQLTQHYRSEVDQAITSAVTTHPILKDAVEGIEVLLLADIAPRVAEMIRENPEVPVDLVEVKQMIAAAAGKRAERFTALTVNATKQAAVNAARLKQTSPAPAGGVAPSQRPARPQQFKLGGKELVNAAIADLQRGGARP